tara:strand:+ start:12156 stop:12299 length:144 start_codon:yes stop_codon:yes gene_type:complete
MAYKFTFILWDTTEVEIEASTLSEAMAAINEDSNDVPLDDIESIKIR